VPRAAGDLAPSGRRPLSDQRTGGLPTPTDPFRLKRPSEQSWRFADVDQVVEQRDRDDNRSPLAAAY